MVNEHALLHGLMAEFSTSADLLRAAGAAHKAGYRKLDAYSPFPIEGLSEAIGFRRTRLPLVILIGAALGMLGGYFLQYWCAAIAYPVEVAGKPLNSWPMFIPIAFELTILAGALTAFFAMLISNGLPMPYHPVFHVSSFKKASRDGFFLCIEARDPMFELATCRQFMAGLGPVQIDEVPA